MPRRSPKNCTRSTRSSTRPLSGLGKSPVAAAVAVALAGPKYKFPLSQSLPKHQSMTTGQLLNNLIQLTAKWQPDGSCHAPLRRDQSRRVQYRYCAQLCAAYRALASGPCATCYQRGRVSIGEHDADLLNDRQVLDLHWLCAQQKSVRTLNAKVASPLRAAYSTSMPPPCSSPSRGAPNVKVTELLSVRYADQMELSTLQTDAIDVSGTSSREVDPTRAGNRSASTTCAYSSSPPPSVTPCSSGTSRAGSRCGPAPSWAVIRAGPLLHSPLLRLRSGRRSRPVEPPTLVEEDREASRGYPWVGRDENGQRQGGGRIHGHPVRGGLTTVM